MNNQGTILICPQCATREHQQVLGSISVDGNLYIKRSHHGTTVIQSPNLIIMCACGYTTSVYTTQPKPITMPLDQFKYTKTTYIVKKN